METFPEPVVAGAATDAIPCGAPGFDAVKPLVVARIERRPPRLNTSAYPYLPRSNVATTRAADYAALLREAVAPDMSPMEKGQAKPQVLLAHHLKALRLPTFLSQYEKLAGECAREGVDHPRHLLRLAELELIERERRMIDRQIRAAKFPAIKTLDSFDFTAIPTLNKMLVLELARGEYSERRENACFPRCRVSVFLIMR
jgi:hypothetical protein